MDVAHRNRACTSLRAPERHVVGEAELKEVVARDHERVVPCQDAAVEDEPDVADRAEAVVVGRRSVVVDRDPPTADPVPEPGRLPRVRHEVHLVHLVYLVDLVEDPVDDRAPADRQQLLRDAVGERPKTRRVPSRQNERLHVRVTYPASNSVNGARWTPRSVTIAVINAAGVTSNAGFRAMKRSVISVGSRSSIGISEPVAVQRSTVDVGATT